MPQKAKDETDGTLSRDEAKAHAVVDFLLDKINQRDADHEKSKFIGKENVHRAIDSTNECIWLSGATGCEIAEI